MNTDEKVNILMVDDQPAKLLSYEVVLHDLGENLIKATSGRDALEQLLKNDIAVVLMDVSMPEIDGFELADMIRQHPRFHKTAIIFISGIHLSDLDRIKGYQRGAVDYISVPVVPDVLRAKVSVFAELHRKTRQLEQLNRVLEQRVEERTEELRESESQFRTLANSIPQLAWMADADGSVIWYNQRWYEYSGLSDEEMKGSGWQSLHHPDHAARVVAGLQRCWDTGEPWEDTFPLKGLDGQYRWFLSRAVPIRDSHGNIVRWFGTNTDVSRQIAAEEQIRNLNAQLEQRLTELETIMQVLPVGVAVAQDPACRSITANANLTEVLGLSQEDNVPPTFPFEEPLAYKVYRNGKPVPGTELPVQKAAMTGRPVKSTELEIRRQDGTVTHLMGSASPLFDGAGHVRGAVGAFFDVTSRKKMEDMLRERADLLELASEAIIVRDPNGVLQYWNCGAEILYGWKREEVLGNNIHEVLQTKFPVSDFEIEATIEEAGRWDGRLVQRTKDGHELIVASRQALKAEGQAILEINRDITAQLKAEDALRSAERLAAMGRMAGIIAHEINNPLEAITNAFYLLRDHPSLDDEARYFAQLGEQELLRVAHITKQTLSFYRESQKPIPLSVAELLDNVLELQTRRLQLARIKVDKRYRSTGSIQGFPAELKQVFLNLIGNAIQAMPNGGRMRVSVFERSDWKRQGRVVCIAICDTGSGVKVEDGKRLFEPFFTTKFSKGTGLGLWISKGIIQKYDGDIRFRTVFHPNGNVTSFRVLIPVVRAENEQNIPVEHIENSRREAARGSA